MRKENQHGSAPSGSEPRNDQSELPPALIDAMRGQEYACVTTRTQNGTAFVVKAPELDLQSIGGVVPIALRHELYRHSCAPVIRTLLLVYDRPHAPLALETFINVADEHQRADLAALAVQAEFEMLFYDEELRYRLAKRVTHTNPDATHMVLLKAQELLREIPVGQVDFDAAKADVMRQAQWPPLRDPAFIDRQDV